MPSAHATKSSTSSTWVVLLLTGILAALLVVIVLLGVIILHNIGAKITPATTTDPAGSNELQHSTAVSTANATRPGESQTTSVPANPSPSSTPAGRSAIAQPGETFTKPISPTRLDGETTRPQPSSSSTSAPTSVVPWTLAHQHIGKTITVEGQIIDTHNTGSVCFLNFVRDRQSFYIIIFKDSLNAWPQPPDSYFLNKTIRVTGTVSERSGRAQIQVRQPSQIAVVP